MISTKGKRKVNFGGETFYWYVKKNAMGSPKIHISSEDKKVRWEYGFDREMTVDNGYIKKLLETHFENNGGVMATEVK